MFKVKSLSAKIKLYYLDLVMGRSEKAQDALFCFFLLLVSFIYGFFVKLILFFYQTGIFRSFKPNCRVISVGNLTWGGTGKTPFVQSIAEFLKQEGKKPIILIRGYGQDEVYMLKDKFKDISLLAGRDRIKTAKIALERYGADTIVLDDGFQHRRLKRDLDIVLIDASLPFGNRRLIPRGLLREPLSSLSRADIFVLTKTDLARENVETIKDELKKYNPRAPIYEAIHAPVFLRRINSNERIEISTIKSQQIALLCGIASPESLAKTLDLLGAQISARFYFPDHYQYTQEDLKKIERTCLEHQIKTIVTTEKDAARLVELLKSERLKIELLALVIEFKITQDKEKFFRSLIGSQGSFSILILNDGKAGHLNQEKAVAQIIQERKIAQGQDAPTTKIVEVKFKNRFLQALLSFCAIFSAPNCQTCLRCLGWCLEKHSFLELMQMPANIIISAGSSLASVNLFLSYRNKARSIVLMKPAFLGLDKFDLAIVPEHDQIKPKNNILVTRIAPNLIDQKYLEEQANVLNIKSKPRGPTIGVLIGGNTRKYKLSVKLMNKIISQLKEEVRNLAGQILATTSRRTPPLIEKLLKENLIDFPLCKLLIIANEKNIPQAVGGILGLSDIILVSGESISMVSEAVSADKYVLVFKAEKKAKTLTKQDRFLEKLAKEKIITVIQPGNLAWEIETIWKDRPYRKKIEDRELIYQALARIL